MRKLPSESAFNHQNLATNKTHESAQLHVTGQARYVDDIAVPSDCLHAYVGGVTVACGSIKSIDIDPVKAMAGVVDVITAADIPGHKDIGPVFPGDPLLAEQEINYCMQPVIAVAAMDRDTARRAAKALVCDVEPHAPILDLEAARTQQRQVRPSHSLVKGDATKALTEADNTLVVQQQMQGQEHFYLEGQIALALPQEDGGVLVHCSSQHPSEVQKLVAEVLGIPMHLVVVDMRRMGGGFGGKETQAAQWACLAALLAVRNGKAVKLRLSRSDDIQLTGKRHGFVNEAKVGFDSQGYIQALQAELNGLCGSSPDLSDAIVDRAMFHTDNAYYWPHAHITGHRWFQNTVSQTAFRGFGGPQGVIFAEQIMDDVARAVGEDPLNVRLRNLYSEERGLTTPYHQQVTGVDLPRIINELCVSSDYWQRRQDIKAFNQSNPRYVRGLALTPVKFGISFTAQFLNQAGALVHIYTDGSVQVNHGGTEMGQGLHTKISQIAAAELGLGVEAIKVTSTRTDKVPNTSPTAASSGTDLNGQATRMACVTLRQRLAELVAEQTGCQASEVTFSQGMVSWPGGQQSFAELVQQAYLARVSLSATGFYKTPKIYYDREQAKGRPFYYFTCGAAVSEVEIDRLSGMYQVKRVDILHDAGRSINPAIDIGQIEGAFIQGMGWLTSEELVWSDQGQLQSNSGATYKIPAIGDTPAVFKVNLLADSENEEATIYHSKAVGEPPFMYGISVWSALRDAVHSVGQLAGTNANPPMPAPATPERVLWALQQAEEGE
jgi:xanthine dehydrogenase large subunit